MEKKERMTAAEAAEYLRMTVSNLYKLAKVGAIPFHRRPSIGERGGMIWFLRAELDAWEESGRNR